MRGTQQTTKFILVLSGALPCASIAAASGQMPTEVLQASGGLTLGSAALITIAGAVITFGKSRTHAPERSGNS